MKNQFEKTWLVTNVVCHRAQVSYLDRDHKAVLLF